ncbi:MAG: L,D-transpeptidase [Caldimicrobium sp.]|nr:L,D-transpeptidase [Caldimicrobium sp.]MDW8183528.1 L,D-transpeptidase [Caldimicrobium sp.]
MFLNKEILQILVLVIFLITIFTRSTLGEEVFLIYDKADYRLYLRKGESILFDMPGAQGLKASLPKRKKGDFLTPEGIYHIKEIRPSNLYHVFVELSYPNKNDIALAYYRGEIDWAKLKEIWTNSSSNSKKILGYAIGIHGGGNSKQEKEKLDFNWTQGCIALNNSDLDRLIKFLKPMQRVYIIDSQKPLFEMLKKLAYPLKVKPLDFWEGGLYFKINNFTFWYFHIKEEAKGSRILLWEEWVRGRLNERKESGLDGRFDRSAEEMIKKTVFQKINYILDPMVRIDLEEWK